MTQDDLTEASTQRTVFVYDSSQSLSPKATEITIEIPRECPECGFENFNVWGTKMNGMVNIVVKCMRCGK